MEICESLGVAVPDEVAILAGDTDELICSISSPPLSSVRLAARRLGYEAAAMLDRLMNGQRVPKKATYIRPLGVVSRQSTDLLAIDDEDAAAAIRFIRNYATEGIGVSDILREVPVSRRSLEQKFDKHLGRSPAEEIRRVRLDKARDLLLRSELSIKQVALASGFQTSSRLGVAFRKRFGLTPFVFRKQSFAELSSDLIDTRGDPE